MNKVPEGFPLPPMDVNGNLIIEGDTVKILCIPEWLVHDLDEISKNTVLGCEGANMVVYEIDEYGYVWVETVTLSTEQEYRSNSVCMEPKNLLKENNI